MGMGFCRFDEHQGKPLGKIPGTNVDYNTSFSDQNTRLYICGSLEHYAFAHNVLPLKISREIVMAAGPFWVTTTALFEEARKI